MGDLIAMEKYIISFIDILGFRDDVNSISKSSGKHSELKFKSVKKKVASFVSNLAADADSSTVKIQSFSDCVVRARRVNQTGSLSSILKEEIERISNCQLWCLQDGFIIRGGIAIGNHFDGKIDAKGFGDVDCMISPAMIEAYHLESKLAKYPRIVLHPKTIKEHKLDDWDYLIYDKVSDVYYIDYLWACYSNHGEHDHSRFNEHYNLISTGLMSSNSKVKRKYNWLKGYHNRTLNQIMSIEWNENEAWRQQFSYKQYVQYQKEEMSFL